MRSQLWLLAASSHLVRADGVFPFGQALDHPGGDAEYFLPRITHASTHDDAEGWTPMPTDGPSLELARRRQEFIKVKRQESNTWLDDTTCGWRNDGVSVPWTCRPSHTCTTNRDQVVGCTSSGGRNPFFTVCLDYHAVQAGACGSGVGTKTGCCKTRSIGECITYIWPGSTVKSMYLCHTERTIYTLLSTPFAGTAASPITSNTDDAAATSEPDATSTDTDETRGTAGAQTSSTSSPETSDSGGTNIGAIVGGVVGGLAVLGIIVGVLAFLMRRSRRQQQQQQQQGPLAPGPGAYTAVAPGDPSYPTGHLSQAGGGGASYYSPNSVGSTTLPPGTPYTHHPYYDPGKPGASAHAAYPPYPGGPSPPNNNSGKPSELPTGFPVSELDNTATHMATGHYSNPVEMAAHPSQRR